MVYKKIISNILAGIGGGIIAYALYKALYDEHYDCPNCHNTFLGKQSRCPYCGAGFTW